MKNKKKFTLLLFVTVFMVIGTVGAVFYYEAPGGGVVYAQSSDYFLGLMGLRGKSYSRGEFFKELGFLAQRKTVCSNMGHPVSAGQLLKEFTSSGGFVPPPPPPPPPSFGVSSGGGNDGSGASGGSGGATSGGTSGSGTGASSITINEGGAVTMSFACVDSDSSSGLNFSTGGAASGSVSINPLDTTTYTVVCSNGGRSSVDVTVLHPVLEITADPTQVRSGRESLITWSATVVDSCNVTGTNGFSATGLSGSQPSNPITLQSIFTLTCENVAGTLSKNVTVYLIPEFREF